MTAQLGEMITYLFTGCKDFPLDFCATRWVESRVVAKRAVLIWPHIKELFAFWGKLTKSKQPKCKSYETLKDAVKDQLIIAKLQFFSFVASMVEPYLTSYQTDSPMAPYIYFDLKNLVVNLLKLFIKSEVIENCKTSSDI